MTVSVFVGHFLVESRSTRILTAGWTRKHTLDVTVGLNGPVVTYSNINVSDLMLTNVNSPNATMLTDTITADIVRNNLEFLNDFFLSV
jgi:hypothetical protein